MNGCRISDMSALSILQLRMDQQRDKWKKRAIAARREMLQVYGSLDPHPGDGEPSVAEAMEIVEAFLAESKDWETQ